MPTHVGWQGGGSWLLGWSVIWNEEVKVPQGQSKLFQERELGEWPLVPVQWRQEIRSKGTGVARSQEARGEGLGSGEAVKGSRQAVGDARLWQAFSSEVPDSMVWRRSINTQRKGWEGVTLTPEHSCG